MPNISINNEKTDIKLKPEQTIQDAMDLILNDVISQQEVVTGININNQELSFEEESEVLEEKVSKYENINFQVKSSKVLALESLDSCSEYLDVIIAKIKSVAKDYNEGQEEAANKGFSELLETIDLFTQLMAKITKTLAQSNSSFKKSESLQELEIHLLSVLKMMIPAREKNDIIMLCDLLEYELLDNLSEWKSKAIPELKQARDS